MFIKTLELGPLGTNCYIVGDGKSTSCAIVDPGADASTILNFLEDNKLQAQCVLLTHGHFDHTGAIPELMEELGLPLYMHKGDDGITIGSEYYLFNAPEGVKFVAEGDTVCVGELSFSVMETPGHTPGSVCFICRQKGEDPAIFSGDTLFKDSCGRTDFPMSSTEQMMASLKRLYELPGDYEVYPGHMFATTLERERRYNYFMLMALRG